MAYTGDLQVIPPAGRGRMNIHVEWYEDGANVTNNTSVIHMSGYIYNPDGATLFDTYGNGQGVIRLYWHDNRQGTKYLSADTVVTILAGYQTINVSGSIIVTHNGDGSLLGYGGIEWVKESSLNWMPETCFVNTGGYVALTTIPRASEVTGITFGNNWDDTIRVTYNRKSGSFREKLAIKIDGGKTLKTIQGYESGASVTFSESEKNIVREFVNTHGTLTYNVVLETYTSDYATKIGTSNTYSHSYNFISAPDVQVTVTEVGITGRNVGALETVAIIGKKKISVTVIPKNWADIKAVKAYAGGRSTTITVTKQASGVYTGEVTITNLTNADYMVLATDSRNADGKWETKGTFKAYSPPNILNVVVQRTTQTSSNATLAADGIYYNGVIGNTTNAITIAISGAATGDATPAYNGNKWNTSKTINGADPKNAYKYAVTVTDVFGQKITVEYSLGASKPVMSVLEKEVCINGSVVADDYYFKTKRLIDFFYPVGSILMNENKDYDPNKLLGGKWEKIEDKFLIGAGRNTPIKSQGGSATHAHGNRDGRNGNLAAAIGATNNNPGVIGYRAVNDTNIGAVGGATYAVAGTNIGFASWNHFTAVVGQTAEASTLPPYYAINIWRRTE